jgi:vanadium chloroperoxidase
MGTLPVDPVTRLPVYVARTAEETLIGLYWAYDGASGLGTPPRLYNQIVREVADEQGNDVAANARLFALVNVAMGDAGILAWEQKYLHDLWRPVLGIREHDPSLGPAAVPGNPLSDHSDPGWLPLGAPRTNVTGGKNSTPPFPAYPSGHATFGAAAFQSVRQYYYPGRANGPDDLTGDRGFISDELNGINRDNKGVTRPRHVRDFSEGLWQMIEENGRSRVYLGVHWIFDAFATDTDGAMDLDQNIGGVPLGLTIANDIAQHGLKHTNGAPPSTP